MPSHLISVVMGVRNGGDRLSLTIDSILKQEDVELEFIIVDDGSTDITPEILRHAAQNDERIRIVTREKRGLTASLIEGCQLARGEFIARQDANDISLPDRLRVQLATLKGDHSVAFCSTHVRFVTKEGVTALTSCPNTDENRNALRGIIHGSTMIRKDYYHRVGGYRPMFYYAQDVDLWSRLLEIGRHVIIPSIYYEALIFADSISGTKKKEQEKFFYYISSASNSRERNKSEDKWLELAEAYSKKCQKKRAKSSRDALGAYFIGSCLSNNNPTLARSYFRMALRNNPAHLKARLRLITLR